MDGSRNGIRQSGGQYSLLLNKVDQMDELLNGYEGQQLDPSTIMQLIGLKGVVNINSQQITSLQNTVQQLPITQGGTGGITQQAAIDNLCLPGTLNNTYVLTSDGIHMSLEPPTGGGTSALANNLTGTVLGIQYQQGINSTTVIPLVANTSCFLKSNDATHAPTFQAITTNDIQAALPAIGNQYNVLTNQDGANWSSQPIPPATNIENGLIGQIPVQHAASTTQFISNGTTGQVLTANTGIESTFQDLPVPNKATNIANGILYDIPYQTATNITSFIGHGLVSGKVLTSHASSSAPSFDDLPNTIAMAGNLISTSQNNYIPYQSADNTTNFISPSSSGYVLTSNGISAAPSFQISSGSSGIVAPTINTVCERDSVGNGQFTGLILGPTDQSIDQTIKGIDSIGTNMNGKNLIINSSQPTGNGLPGKIQLQNQQYKIIGIDDFQYGTTINSNTVQLSTTLHVELINSVIILNVMGATYLTSSNPTWNVSQTFVKLDENLIQTIFYLLNPAIGDYNITTTFSGINGTNQVFAMCVQNTNLLPVQLLQVHTDGLTQTNTPFYQTGATQIGDLVIDFVSMWNYITLPTIQTNITSSTGNGWGFQSSYYVATTTSTTIGQNPQLHNNQHYYYQSIVLRNYPQKSLEIDTTGQVNIYSQLNLTNPLSLIDGGTGQNTQQLSLNALTIPTGNTNKYLYSNGTNSIFQSIQSSDIQLLGTVAPTASTLCERDGNGIIQNMGLLLGDNTNTLTKIQMVDQQTVNGYGKDLILLAGLQNQVGLTGQVKLQNQCLQDNVITFGASVNGNSTTSICTTSTTLVVPSGPKILLLFVFAAETTQGTTQVSSVNNWASQVWTRIQYSSLQSIYYILNPIAQIASQTVNLISGIATQITLCYFNNCVSIPTLLNTYQHGQISGSQSISGTTIQNEMIIDFMSNWNILPTPGINQNILSAWTYTGWGMTTSYKLATTILTTMSENLSASEGYFLNAIRLTPNQCLQPFSGLILDPNQNVIIPNNLSTNKLIITDSLNNIIINCTGGSPTMTTGSQNIFIGSTVIEGDGSGLQGAGTQTTIIGGTTAIYNSKNTTVWQQISDLRIKKNIVLATKGLTEIMQLVVKNFNYKTVSESGGLLKNELPTGLITGMIAQEVAQIFPECVIDNNGIYCIDYSFINMILIKAVQELKVLFDDSDQCHIGECFLSANVVLPIKGIHEIHICDGSTFDQNIYPNLYINLGVSQLPSITNPSSNLSYYIIMK